MVKNPEWLEKDRSVIIGVAIMYCVFLFSITIGQRKKRVDDKYFVDGVKCEYMCTHY